MLTLTRIKNSLAVIRLRPFDTSDEGGRAAERHRRIALSAIASLLAKFVHSACMLVSIPVAIHYLGNERYGLWQTIGSVIAMLAFSDLGMGNGMISVLADTSGRDDRGKAQRVVSSSTFMLILIALVGAAVFAIVFPNVNWPRAFKATTPQLAPETAPTVLWCIGLFLLGMPLGVVQSVHLGYQEGFAPYVVQAATSVLSLAGLFLAIHLKLGIAGLMALSMGASLLVRAGDTTWVFAFQRPWLAPRWRDFHWTTAVALIKVSALYMVIGMSIAVGYTSDSLVVEHILGNAAVAEYNVPYKLFSVVTVVMGFFLTPLWPAYAEANARGDAGWIRRTLRRSLLISVAINTAAAVVLVFAGEWVVKFWVRGAVTPTLPLMLAFGLYLVVHGMYMPLNMYLNGLSVIRFQFICWTSMAVLNLALSIVLTKRFGVSGVVFGTVVANFVCFVVPGAWYIRKHLRTLGAGVPRLET